MCLGIKTDIFLDFIFISFFQFLWECSVTIFFREWKYLFDKTKYIFKKTQNF